jgi:ribonucleoside-diphosphate reductase beta chain
MTVFNAANSGWKTKQYPLFMGEEMALYDSVNVNYKELFDVYKQQVSQRWVETEFNHEQSRLDMISCPKNIYDVMLLNLSFQWVLDSVASRAIAPLFAPFVTNSELWAALMENSNMEVIHALSYSEIVRQCVADPTDVFKLSVQNEKTIQRAVKVVSVFDELQKAGAEYTLGIRKNDQSTYNIVFKGLVALYILERLQFLASFAATFAVVEQGYFQSIGKMVQKIMLDEIFCHYTTDALALKIELSTERGKIAMRECKDEILEMIAEVRYQERQWSDYLFSEGRSIVGLNPLLLNEWVDYNAQAVYDGLGLSDNIPFERVKQNPLKWMDNWIEIDKFQNCMQEADGNNYALNVVKDDITDEELDF